MGRSSSGSRQRPGPDPLLALLGNGTRTRCRRWGIACWSAAAAGRAQTRRKEGTDSPGNVLEGSNDPPSCTDWGCKCPGGNGGSPIPRVCHARNLPPPFRKSPSGRDAALEAFFSSDPIAPQTSLNAAPSLGTLSLTPAELSSSVTSWQQPPQ